MTETDFALIQEVKRAADSLEVISGCIVKLAGLFNVAPSADFEQLKKGLLAEVRKVLSESLGRSDEAKPTKRWFETTEVAKELNVKPATIRGRCFAGLIAAEKWGKEWKIPAAELERLKKDGLPPLKPVDATCPA